MKEQDAAHSFTEGMDITKGQMRSKIADKILSETPQETRDHTKDYWKGRSDQYEIDSAELTRLRSELQQKDEEIERLKNDLDDAIDVKNGQGPTALSRLMSELQQERELRKELLPLAERMIVILGEYANEHYKELIKKAKLNN